MTTTYNPQHPSYFDELDTRNEAARVFDVCNGCQQCTDLCPTFPTLFGFIQQRPERDAGLMTPAQQDQVADECVQCTLCYLNCPYTPDTHELSIDFPRLMVRLHAMRRKNGYVTLRDRLRTHFAARRDFFGKIGTATSSLRHRVASRRTRVTAVADAATVRLSPPYAKQRFSTWFWKRDRTATTSLHQGSVILFPTCLVEYQEPGIGRDVVAVYERNGVECTLIDGVGCCGAPLLASGDVNHFVKIAKRNIARLVAAVRQGTDIVVPQPTCSYVIKNEYVHYVGGPDAEVVSQHTFDTSEYLMSMYNDENSVFDSAFVGEVSKSIVYHVPCHLKAQDAAEHSLRLMELTGATVEVMNRCAGANKWWTSRPAADASANSMPRRFVNDVVAHSNSDVVGDCHLANLAITEISGRSPMHPLQVLARAYGLNDDNSFRPGD